MAWRYRKRINIVPGVNINLSKSGISTTIGKKGASVNIGKKGTYLNTGIPGTGLYNRTKLKGNNLKDMGLSEKKRHNSNIYDTKNYPNNKSSSSNGCLHNIFSFCSTVSEIALPIYIAYCIFKHSAINYTIVGICTCFILLASLYFYKERNDFKKVNDVEHWLRPLEGFILFWLFCSIGLAFFHLLYWLSGDIAFNVYYLINPVVSFFLFGFISEKRTKKEKLLKRKTDYRIKKDNINILTMLANESDREKKVFYYGEILFNGGSIDSKSLTSAKMFPDILENKDKATLILDTDLHGIEEYYEKIKTPLVDGLFRCCWELLSYSRNYKGYYYNKNLERERSYVSFENSIFNHVASPQQVVSFETSKKTNYIYPQFWIVAENSANFDIYSIGEVDISIKEIDYIETEKRLNIYEKEIDTTIINKKTYSVFKYALVTIVSSNDAINYSLVFTNYNDAKKWVEGYNNYKQYYRYFMSDW